VPQPLRVQQERLRSGVHRYETRDQELISEALASAAASRVWRKPVQSCHGTYGTRNTRNSAALRRAGQAPHLRGCKQRRGRLSQPRVQSLRPYMVGSYVTVTAANAAGTEVAAWSPAATLSVPEPRNAEEGRHPPPSNRSQPLPNRRHRPTAPNHYPTAATVQPLPTITQPPRTLRQSTTAATSSVSRGWCSS
jgi:hypothetical protein